MSDNHSDWRYKQDHLDNIDAMGNIHIHEEQLGRQARAREKKCTPINLDRERQTAEFQGSEKIPYFTTLDSCTCRDFSLRQLPCKHMYRLAHELEIYTLSQVEEGEVISLFDPEILNGLSENILYKLWCEISGWIYGRAEWIEKRNEDTLVLIEYGFLEAVDRPELLLNEKSISELRAPLKKAGLKCPPRKQDTIKMLLELYPHVADDLKQKYVVVRFQEKWKPIRGKICNYLKRRFSEDV